MDAWTDDEDRTVYEVVRNIYGQYSILAQGKPVPNGWELVGKAGQKSECLGYIEEVWTDMTPSYVRQPAPAADQKR